MRRVDLGVLDLVVVPVANVSSAIQRTNSPYRDVHAALIEFESGCVAQFTASLTAGGRLERYELHGNAVSVYLEGVISGSIMAGKLVSVIPAAGAVITSTFLQDDYFVRRSVASEEFGEPAASLESSLVTLDLAERIYAEAEK